MGIGRAMAECCARRGLNLLLVSLPNEGLPLTAAQIAARHGVQTRFMETDLALPGSARFLREWCESERLEINVLINNAGIGYQGSFDEFDPEFYERLMRVNVIAPALITREFLPTLKRQKKSWVLFSSSFAGFQPVPFKVVYAASKSFITQFARGLFQELKSCGVHVTVVCPAGVDSFPASSARIDQLGWIARSGRLSPEKVAHVAVNGMFAGRKRIIPGKINIVLYFVMRLLPAGFVARVMHNALRKFHAPVLEYGLMHQTEAANPVGEETVTKTSSD